MADIDEMFLEEELWEGYESDDESIAEDEEALLESLPPSPFIRGRRQRPPTVASNRSYFTPRMSPFVSQPQLASALAKIRSDIKTLSTRVTAEQAVNVRQNRELMRQNKTNIRQDKEIVGLKKGLKKASDMSLLLLLLSKPKTTSPTIAEDNVGGVPVPVGSKLLVETGKDNTLLLALMLSGGLGGGNESDNTLLLALALGGGL